MVWLESISLFSKLGRYFSSSHGNCLKFIKPHVNSKTITNQLLILFPSKPQNSGWTMPRANIYLFSSKFCIFKIIQLCEIKNQSHYYQTKIFKQNSWNSNTHFCQFKTRVCDKQTCAFHIKFCQPSLCKSLKRTMVNHFSYQLFTLLTEIFVN